MSFGFGIGDFVTIGRTVLTLYNACQGAPGELGELRRDLSSIHILLADLERQAQDPTSLLHQKCSDKRPAWLQVRTNLEETLKELEVLVGKYKSMGRNAWLRIQLGSMDLSVIRGKLDTHLNTMNALFNSMSLSSLGRVEAELGSLSESMKLVLSLLMESIQAERAGQKAPTVLSAFEAGNGPEWARMKMELIVAGVPSHDLESQRDRVEELLNWVVNSPDLDKLNEVDVDDSISQCGSDIYVSSTSNGQLQPQDRQTIRAIVTPTREECIPPATSTLSQNVQLDNRSQLRDAQIPPSITEKNFASVQVKIIKIMIVDDKFGHFGPTFEFHLKQQSPRFEFKSPKTGEPFSPEFQISFSGANPESTQNRLRQTCSDFLEMRRGVFSISSNVWISSDNIQRTNYDHVLLVPSYIGEKYKGWRTDYVKVSYPDKPVWITSYFGMPRKSYENTVFRPVKTSSISWHKEDYYYERADRQVSNCAIGFLYKALQAQPKRRV